MEIQRNPVDGKDGKKTTPVAWESSCLEEVCGACSMVINGGDTRQACTALIDQTRRTNSTRHRCALSRLSRV